MLLLLRRKRRREPIKGAGDDQSAPAVGACPGIHPLSSVDELIKHSRHPSWMLLDLSAGGRISTIFLIIMKKRVLWHYATGISFPSRPWLGKKKWGEGQHCHDSSSSTPHRVERNIYKRIFSLYLGERKCTDSSESWFMLGREKGCISNISWMKIYKTAMPF